MDRGDETPPEITATGSVLVDDPELRAKFLREDGSAPPHARGQILVVEADQSGVCEMLAALGFAVVRAPDGVVASQRLATSRFDAVLSEVFLPALSGIELLRYAKEHDMDLPVILMTGAPDVETAAQAVELGAFQYLLKPTSAERIAAAMERAVIQCRVSRAKSAALKAAAEPVTQQHDMRMLCFDFQAVLDAIYMAYQPIVLASGEVVAHEALVRSDNPQTSTAAGILDLAEHLEQMLELGRTVRARVGGDLATLGAGSVFVNLHASEVLDDALLDSAGPLTPYASRVVLEITERAAVQDVAEVKRRMNELRAMGFRIALDDLGAGYAGLTSFAELRPDIVKLDQTLVRSIDEDHVKRKIVSSLIAACREIGTTVVGEGVETVGERDVLVSLGCQLLQGYYFGRPARRN